MFSMMASIRWTVANSQPANTTYIWTERKWRKYVFIKANHFLNMPRQQKMADPAPVPSRVLLNKTIWDGGVALRTLPDWVAQITRKDTGQERECNWPLLPEKMTAGPNKPSAFSPVVLRTIRSIQLSFDFDWVEWFAPQMTIKDNGHWTMWEYLGPSGTIWD